MISNLEIEKEFMIPGIKDEKREKLGLFIDSVRDYINFLENLDKRISSERKVDAEKNLYEFSQMTDKMLENGDSLERTLENKKDIEQIKKTFRKFVGKWIYQSHIVKRAYEKPKGYPGDFEMMELIYNNKPFCMNERNIKYYIEQYFLNSQYAVSVRNRKNKIKSLIENEINKSISTSFKIMNIACGSCREIKEMLADKKNEIGKNILQFLFVDQDPCALKF